VGPSWGEGIGRGRNLGAVLVAVVLAAGAGSRFHADHHKLLTELDGAPLVHHAIRHALAADIGPVVVVTGAIDLQLPADLAGAVRLCHNPSWADGQSSSIAVAIDAAADLGADAVVIGLGDQPGIPPTAWTCIAATETDLPIVVASYDGRRGPHPVRLHRSVWPMLSDSGDDGARTLMREHPTLVREVPCPGTAADIDTLEDVQRWKSS
jgi:molybdenum cofactor cytidylyltransferase